MTQKQKSNVIFSLALTFGLSWIHNNPSSYVSPLHCTEVRLTLSPARCFSGRIHP